MTPDTAGIPVTAGVDLGGTGIRVVAVDGDGAVRDRASMPTPTTIPAEEAVGNLVKAIGLVAGEARLDGVGIGASGPVDELGIIRNAATLPAFTDIPLRDIVRERLGVRCVIENDAAAAAIGEHAYGAGDRSAGLLVITLGTGVGVAVLRHGELFKGCDGMHPEASHIAVDYPDAECYCGLSACWEQVASRRALDRILDGADIAEAAHRCRNGDTVAVTRFEQYGAAVGAGLHTLLTIFRPDRIVVCGSVARHLDVFLPALRRRLSRGVVHYRTPPIVPAGLGDVSGAVGAAVLARSAV